MTSKNLTRRRVPSRPTRDRHRLRPTLTMLEDRQLLSSFIVNNPTDTPVTGQTDLRQAIVQATTDTTNDTITFDPTVFSTPQTDHPELGPAQPHEGQRHPDDPGPRGEPAVGQRQQRLAGVLPERRFGVSVGADGHRRQLRPIRRRPVQLGRHGHADQLHRQRQLRRQPRRRPGQLRRHGDADQLHRQRQHRRQPRRRPVQLPARPR